MRKFLIFLLPFCCQIFVYAQHLNVVIGTKDNPNEPAICQDPKNPARLVAGANLNNLYVSQDTGRTWTESKLTSTYGVWGDPVITVDTNGHFYFFHLSNPPNGSWIDRIVCQKSTTAGKSWSSGTFTGLNGSKDQDKQWVAIDRSNNHLYMTWTEFDSYGSPNLKDSSRILFSKSTNGGDNWSSPQKINRISGDCVDSDNTTEGAVPCIGPKGEIYVSWTGPEGLVFDRSTDGGLSWLAKDIKIDPMPGGWDYEIPGLQRCNGLPITACDLSNGPYRGTIYVNWSDQRNGTNDTDIWLSKSEDGGNNWSAPIRVNDDGKGRHQFLTWMAIDQSTGWLWFVFYDRRNYPGSNTDVFMALSTDGGQTFRNFKVSEKPFLPSSGQFFGDYNHITAHNNVVRPMWTRMDGLTTSVLTAIVDVNKITTHQQNTETDIVLEDSFPNPSSGVFWVPFKIRKDMEVSMEVLDMTGKLVKTIFANKSFSYGKYTEKADLSLLPKGEYNIVIRQGTKMLTKKLVLFN